MSLLNRLFKRKDKIDSIEEKKYSDGLSKSRTGFTDKLTTLSKKSQRINDEYYEQLFDLLIEADVGVSLASDIINNTKKVAINDKITDSQAINDLLLYFMFNDYLITGHQGSSELIEAINRPTIILIVGVNGSGKTTSIAKLAYRYKQRGKRVLLIAGDTFRAGAQEQLSIWAKRIDCPLVSGNDKEDPGSVVYRGIQEGIKLNSDFIIIDTAGRLTNKTNLMDELTKIHRIIARYYRNAPDEVLLVLDATTGQNGIVQAQAFSSATDLTGVIMTKMDGTSKGGILLAVHDLIKAPIRFIGLGETLEDLVPFDIERYLRGLLQT
jgi:fused signal recognition particle receptor